MAEYFRLKDQTYTTVGLGATISRATDSGNFALLLGSTIVMAIGGGHRESPGVAQNVSPGRQPLHAGSVKLPNSGAPLIRGFRMSGPAQAEYVIRSGHS